MGMDRACYTVFLHHDLILEILSWTPVKALMRFRSVCKSWNSLIFDSFFVKLHLQRSCKDTPILFSLVNLSSRPHPRCTLHSCSIDRLLGDPSSTLDDAGLPFSLKYSVIGVCNGLVCLRTITRAVWVQFWNPATRLVSKKSPCIPTGFKDLKMGFGYDDSSDTYKVVAVVVKGKEIELRVHCMGDNGWTKVASWTGFPSILGNKGRFVSDTLNWPAKLDTTNQYVIFSFDIKKETYRYLSLPGEVSFERVGQSEIGVLRGCLCLSNIHEGTHFTVWQMKEFGVQKSWTLLIKVSYEHLQISLSPRPKWCMPANNDVLLVSSMSKLVYNRPKDNKVEHVEIPQKIILWCSNDYVQSLVLPYRI